MRHLPSGVSVRCTQERSQLMNRAIALETLRAKLLVVKMEQKVRVSKEPPTLFVFVFFLVGGGNQAHKERPREREREGKGVLPETTGKKRVYQQS